MTPDFSKQGGAYVLVIELESALQLDIASLAPVLLPRGRYAYCGSAYGPGGIRARVARHLRHGKARRWHVDHLTEAGRLVDVRAWPDGRECDLLARILRVPGSDVPIPGFGSSDCRQCPAHLAAVPAGSNWAGYEKRGPARPLPSEHWIYRTT